MTDGKVQDCRNGCGRKIFVSDRTGKWLPYDIGTDNKHDCPNWKSGNRLASSQQFADNKVRYGTSYAGPSVDYNMQKDLADLVVWKDGAELRIKELERTLSGLDSAIAKISLSKASDLIDEPVDESTN